MPPICSGRCVVYMRALGARHMSVSKSLLMGEFITSCVVCYRASFVFFECPHARHSRPFEAMNAFATYDTRGRLRHFPRVCHASVHQALKDARKVVPTTMAMSSPPLSASSSSSSASELAVAGGPDAGDRSIVSRALLPPGGGPVAAGRGEAEAAAAADEGRHGDGLSYVEKLEIRAEEIMGRVLGLAAFCERAGAAKDIDVSVKGCVVCVVLCYDMI